MKWLLVLVIFCLLAIFPVDALAYLDPGTGSYILQLVIGGLVSVLFVIKVFWRKILDKISNVFKRGE